MSLVSPPCTPPRRQLDPSSSRKRALPPSPAEPASGRRFQYTTSSMCFSSPSSLASSSSSQLLPSAPLFPPRTPTCHPSSHLFPTPPSTKGAHSGLRRSPGTNNLNLFTQSAFAEAEAVEFNLSPLHKSIGTRDASGSGSEWSLGSRDGVIRMGRGGLLAEEGCSSPELPESPESMEEGSTTSSDDEMGRRRMVQMDMGLDSSEEDDDEIMMGIEASPTRMVRRKEFYHHSPSFSPSSKLVHRPRIERMRLSTPPPTPDFSIGLDDRRWTFGGAGQGLGFAL